MATKSSNIFITTANNEDAIPNGIPVAYDFAINVKPRILNMIIWPALMLANRRIINENGLVKIPTNSIGTRMR